MLQANTSSSCIQNCGLLPVHGSSIPTMQSAMMYYSQHLLTLQRYPSHLHTRCWKRCHECDSSLMLRWFRLSCCRRMWCQTIWIIQWVRPRSCGCPGALQGPWMPDSWTSDTVFKPASTVMVFSLTATPMTDNHFCISCSSHTHKAFSVFSRKGVIIT